MNREKVEMYESLLCWLKVLNLGELEEDQDIYNGVLLAKLLNQISPDIFSDNWLGKIKMDVKDNLRIKKSNLKKVVDGVYDYYEALSLSLTENLKPDLIKIAEKDDTVELGKLVQLILGCAVNCPEKQQYITQIMDMEEALQQNIMKALQDIEFVWSGTSPNRNSINLPGSTSEPVVLSQSATDERDVLAQKCHERDRQISVLIEEKQTLQSELHKLQSLLDKFENPSTIIGDDGASIGPVQLGSSRYNDLRKQVDHLKNELLQSETVKEDLRMKSMQQDREITGLQNKIDQLEKTSSELAMLKDEIDVLRESCEKSKIYETQLQTLKKKLEDYNDLKRQIKSLEDRGAEVIKQNMQFEDDAKRFSGLKGQVELYKKEVQDLHSKLDSEMSKTVKVEFDLNVMSTKISGVQRERDNLMNERDQLRETVDELRCNQSTSSGDSPNNVSRELLGDSLKEKVQRLEVENKALREGQGGQTALAQLLDDSNQRNEKLREQLKSSNQKILLLSQNEDGTKNDTAVQLKQAVESNEQRGNLLEEAQNQITNLHNRVRQLETSLQNKDQELTTLDTKYRKCVEKAKEVIKSLDPRAIGEAQLIDKSSEADADPPMSRMEERLLTSAFYRLGVACQREAVDSRLAMLSGQGQSFLARQRQPAARKPLNMNFKK